MKNLLFITWDGPQTSYMEGLFMPIFHETAKKENIQFHVIQFTWADQTKTDIVENIAKNLGIFYTALPILKKPFATLGSLITLFTASKKIERYIKDNNIDVVMPRSTFPAFMINQIKNRNFKIIFDADGLPIEERVDFAGLRKKSMQYRWLSGIERRILLQADHVITRTQKSVEVHLSKIGELYRDKFTVVSNGRNADFFAPDPEKRDEMRRKLGIESDFVWIYCGSLGQQYCMKEMFDIFRISLKIRPSRFLLLTGDLTFAKTNIPEDLKPLIVISSVPFAEIPTWLQAADAGFALRQPSFSMGGVAPIKLAEYLLAGLPVVASAGIGDTDQVLQQFETSFIFKHGDPRNETYLNVHNWLSDFATSERLKTAAHARGIFDLENAAISYHLAFEKLKY